MNHQFIKDRDIVMFSLQPWDTAIGSNFKDMALELSKYNRVLFVNRALDRRSKIRDKNDPKVHARLASIKEGIGEISLLQPGLWIHNPRTTVESINWIPNAFIHDQLNKINNKRLAVEINKAIAQLGFKKVLLINDNDFIRGFYLKEMVHCTHYIFYIRDYMLSVDFFKRHGRRLESGVMRKCDLVVANSAYLAEYARQFNEKSVDIGQGCDLRPFTITNPPPVPEVLKALKYPIIGYVGFISEVRLDEKIIETVAKNFPDCSIVLVGPVDDFFTQSSLNQLPNVHFTGPKNQASLPDYIYHFDICMNPQALNQVTIGNYPRKVDEYLAMGKPVVATRTEAMKMFESYTYLCNTPDDYVQQIRNILQHPEYNSRDQQEKRKQFARSHTWENSIGLLGNAYHTLIKN